MLRFRSWTLCLMALLALALGIVWFSHGHSQRLVARTQPKPAMTLPKLGPAGALSCAEHKVVRKVAPVLGIPYPLEADPGTSVKRMTEDRGTGWFEGAGAEELLIVEFTNREGARESVDIGIDESGAVRSIGGTFSGPGDRGKRFPRNWAEYSNAERARMDAGVANATAALTGKVLAVADAVYVRPDPEEDRISFTWFRREGGIRFNEDRRFFTFRISDMRLLHFVDLFHSRILGSRSPKVPEEKAIILAKSKCESLTFPPGATQPIGSLGYAIALRSTELCYVNPAGKFVALKVPAYPRCSSGDEAILAYVVTFDMELPNHQEPGVMGQVGIWVDADSGAIAGGDAAVDQVN